MPDGKLLVFIRLKFSDRIMHIDFLDYPIDLHAWLYPFLFSFFFFNTFGILETVLDNLDNLSFSHLFIYKLVG
jgi:hypothetical protein